MYYSVIIIIIIIIVIIITTIILYFVLKSKVFLEFVKVFSVCLFSLVSNIFYKDAHKMSLIGETATYTDKL